MGKWKELAGIHTCHADCQKPACVAARQAVSGKPQAMKPTQEQVIAWAQKYGDWNGQTVEMNDVGLEAAYAAAYEAGRESAKLDSIHTCHDQCQRPACVAVREAYEAGRKDEALQRLNKAAEDNGEEL